MFLGTLLRDLATFNPAVTITTQWQQPHASRPQRPNDRPIWAHLTPALSTTLISINRSHANKVRWVGDISNEKGTMLLSLPSLCTKHGWNRATLQRFTPIWDAIPTVTPHNPPPLLRQQTIQWGSQYSGQPLSLSPLPTPPRPHLPYLEQPLGRTFFTPSRSVEAIHVPLHAMLIVPHHLIHWDGRPDTLSYRIGRRTSLQTRHTPAGPEIAVTFWHELRKGTDIWYSPTPREARSRLRLVPIAGCAILTGDLLRTSSTQRHKFIPWTDTTWTHPDTHHTHRGNNNRALIASTAMHRADQAQLPPAHHTPPHATCLFCLPPHSGHYCLYGLRAMAPSCLHTTLSGGPTPLHPYVRPPHPPPSCRTVTTKENRQPMAHGASWAEMALPLLGIFGYTQTTSPTRCEVLSLLASLHHSGDTALQIYDNTTAIGLVILVRSLKRRGGQPRYSNIHRVELRSLMALLNPEGTFAGDWIRAHQDSTSTPDSVLRAKQALLAEADSLATLAHQLLPHTNYAHLIFPDSWELRDHQDHPVTGATAPWLGAIYSRHNWHAAQARKPDARRTIQPLRLNTGELCKWDLPALSFYWRTICYTLHTNEHRFGLTHPQCPAATTLTQDLLIATQAVIPKAWLPDQDIYLPGHCTASASTFTGLTRPQWQTRSRKPSPNSGHCMLPISSKRCVLALHMQRLLGPPRPTTLALDATQLHWESTQCRTPGGLLPRWLYHTALRCVPLLAPRDFWFSQWMGGPNGATFQGPLGASPLCTIPRPPTYNHWWIDATHHPFSTTWWRQLCTEIRTATTSHMQTAHWFVVPEGSPGHTQANSLQITWLLTIPTGQITIRNPSSIHHVSTPQWGKITSSNPTDALRPLDATHWLHRPPPIILSTTPADASTTNPKILTAPIHYLQWAQLNIPAFDQYAHNTRSYLEATYPIIYLASSGWKQFPTMTTSTRDWASTITHLHAPHFHKAWFAAHWATFCQHWKIHMHY
ncbi:hypothetical protein H257_04087 [Aphanomyces astaci]|uniref:Uncharacterized protein n=1 Tax=Aphanomyces astaci TaxID=112090 RepID=W4GVJ3_APHAT|nr:hypothetical protein H257_04087 [Aphanomyces astaci]ETV83336.1 hypothetical protein H257_04087 [Aphanomyces astaci]|eukprot:XP_009826766.1 hypothetical protein H257_04087 [Aphanomyces astaci]